MTKVTISSEVTPELERGWLRHSPIACAVGDAWARLGCMPPSATFDDPLWAALNDLELATRESPLRKVRP